MLMGGLMIFGEVECMSMGHTRYANSHIAAEFSRQAKNRCIWKTKQR
jgi:hypothetical protein